MLTDKSTIEAIKKSRKLVSILFSDIEDSTRHWDRRGDVEARILINRHNQLLFPIVRKYKGKIIKTLGDSIMASFNEPENAVKAAIAIQQVLTSERKKDKYFSLRARIGIHTGKGIVEEDDIFGDVVNIAAKVEAEAVGNQILITTGTNARLPNDTYTITETEPLKLRSKRKPIQLLECNWQEHPSLVAGVKPDALMPLLKRQKFEILSYISIGLVALFFIYHKYLRYILADNNLSMARMVKLEYMPSDYIIFIGIMLFSASGLFVYIMRNDFISRSALKIICGLFGFGIIFLLFHSINSNTEFPFNKRWYESIYKSDRLFVEILINKTQLRTEPGTSSKTFDSLPEGELFIYQDSINKDNIRWDKVKISNNKFAWIAKKIPAAFGVAEEKLTRTQKFSFHYYDLYGLILGFLGFLWGFMNFSIRPN
jgi:adenylate cyclase